MKVKLRQAKIVEVIRKNEQVSVDELAALLDISRETVRRDLIDLANSGKVQKVHGGAVLPRAFGEGSFQQRMSENAEAKARIADVASQLFCPGETMFVDTGSTTLYLAERLSQVSGLTIVTNSTEIASTISLPASGNRTFLLGGEFSSGNRQTVGTMVAAQIRSFRAHHAVLTVGALDLRTGAMDYNIEEAQVARAMIEQSESVTLLVDSSKFNKLAAFEVCPLSRVDRVVCDAAPPDALAKALATAGAKIILAS
ncbi:MAG: DeoR/GlpR family DNA-binding transcription regulator [Hyphomicrobiales bacterium]|nr:DeoR/GlpR family DNA-binding transcription regulator [Hyphomicrobiales bacterium]